MLTFLLICIPFCTVLGLASAVYSYLALKGAAEHADLAALHERSAGDSAQLAIRNRNDAMEYKRDAKSFAERAKGYAAEASAHADDAALALGEMKPETVTIVDKRTGEPLFSYPEIERDCE